MSQPDLVTPLLEPKAKAVGGDEVIPNLDPPGSPTTALKAEAAKPTRAVPAAATSVARVDTALGDLYSQRAALLAGRECKLPGEQDGHVARKWHICPGCYPDA